MITKKQYKILKGIDKEEYQWTEETAIELDYLMKNKLVTGVPLDDCEKYGIYRYSITSNASIEMESFDNLMQKKAREIKSLKYSKIAIFISAVSVLIAIITLILSI